MSRIFDLYQYHRSKKEFERFAEGLSSSDAAALALPKSLKKIKFKTEPAADAPPPEELRLFTLSSSTNKASRNLKKFGQYLEAHSRVGLMDVTGSGRLWLLSAKETPGPSHLYASSSFAPAAPQANFAAVLCGLQPGTAAAAAPAAVPRQPAAVAREEPPLSGRGERSFELYQFNRTLGTYCDKVADRAVSTDAAALALPASLTRIDFKLEKRELAPRLVTMQLIDLRAYAGDKGTRHLPKLGKHMVEHNRVGHMQLSENQGI